MSGESFKIRGHHLNTFAYIASSRFTPQERASSDVSLYESMQHDPEDHYYAQEMLGQNFEGGDRLRTRLTAVFTEFVELKPDELITITTGEMDGICHSCANGVHCRKKGIELALPVGGRTARVYEEHISDMYSVGKFLKIGEVLTQEGNISAEMGQPTASVEDFVTPSKAAIVPIRSNISYQSPVTARSDYVKAVLTHWEERRFLIV